MYRTFIEPAWVDNFINNPNIKLPDDVLFRFYKIIRIKKDEKIALFDGAGRQIEGFLQDNFITNFVIINQEAPVKNIILVQAALEEAKICETVKRACEFGIDQIVIFSADLSQGFNISKISKKLARLEEIVKDAARQSTRLFIPSIKIINDLETALKSFSNNYLAVYGDVEEKYLLSELLNKQNLENLNNILIIVGPEGGLSKKEKLLCKSYNCQGVIWSPFVLRSELASLSAISIVNAYLKQA